MSAIQKASQIINAYIERPEWRTAKEISEVTGIPERDVRKIAEQLMPDKFDQRRAHRATKSKQYAGMEHGAVRVTEYAPSRVAIIEAFRATPATGTEHGR